jgi:hypothetical protein
MKIVSLSWTLAVTAAMTACATKPDKPQPAKNNEGPKLVGRIASVPADKRFVLIQSYEKWNVGAGTVLTTRGDHERTANLLTTGETLGPFAAADVQSGTVEPGDAVYSQHTPKPDAQSTETTASQPNRPPGGDS